MRNPLPARRWRHSFDAVARIRDTTQLLLNVYSGEKHLYLHPMKVWNRYSEKMFLPHRMKKGTQEVSLISDGVAMSRFYQLQQRLAQTGQELAQILDPCRGSVLETLVSPVDGIVFFQHNEPLIYAHTSALKILEDSSPNQA